MTEVIARTGMTSVLVELAEFSEALTFDDLPEAVAEYSKLILYHNLVVALGRRGVPVIGQDRTVWPVGAPSSETATRLTDGLRGPSERTIFTNSLAMGAMAQHDEYPRTFSHFGSTVIPPLLAVADQIPLDGRTFLTAMVAGYEVGAAIGSVSVAETNRRGFRPTGLYGPFAAAGATAKAFKGDPAEIANALAIAASSSAGITQMWLRGTDEWLYQTAAAARNGFLAARLAGSGARGAPDALEGQAGFYRAFSGDDIDSGRALDGLGSSWAIAEVLLKPYPVCAMNQAPVQLAVELRQRHEIDIQEIENLTIVMHPSDLGYFGVDLAGTPPTSTAAMMSARFCVGVALVYGTVDIAHLARLHDEEVRSVAARITLEADPSLSSGHHAEIHISLRDGTTLSSGEARGVRYDRTAARALAERLRPASGLSLTAASALEHFVFNIEDCDDVSELFRLIA